jgi:RNA polymerase sigma-70 factor (ECF subfamily)
MVRSLFRSWPGLLGPSDEQAMWRVQTQDDAAAFATIVRRWEEPIRRLCVRMTGDHHRAEDITQEAFTRVFARRKEYQPQGKFSTFLWRIALNLCHDELRRRRHRAEMPLSDDPDDSYGNETCSFASDAITPAMQTEARERETLVREALQQLPNHYREVVVLRHYQGLKFREIAEVLEVPEGTVKSRMAEALDQLAVRLTEFNPSAAAPAPARPVAPQAVPRTQQAQLV